MTQSTLMVFPCDFPLKIIGEYSDGFVKDITTIILQHFPETPLTNMTSKPSDKGNFMSITVVLHVLDQPSLDDLYRALRKLPGIKMVL